MKLFLLGLAMGTISMIVVVWIMGERLDHWKRKAKEWRRKSGK